MTTEEIILKVQAGDKDAFKTLCDKHKEYIKMLSYKYRSYEYERDDVIQLFMISLYRSCFYYKKENITDADIYVKMIIKRTGAEIVRASNRKKRTINHLNNTCSIYIDNEDNKQIDLIDIIQVTDSAEKIAIEKEEYKNAIDKIKNLLSDKQFKIFELYLKGYRIQTIATILNTNYKSIDNYLYRIKKVLKNNLNLSV